MLACAPVTALNYLLSPYPTHASGSVLFLQRVSDQLAGRHVVYVTNAQMPVPVPPGPQVFQRQGVWLRFSD